MILLTWHWFVYWHDIDSCTGMTLILLTWQWFSDMTLILLRWLWFYWHDIYSNDMTFILMTWHWSYIWNYIILLILQIVDKALKAGIIGYKWHDIYSMRSMFNIFKYQVADPAICIWHLLWSWNIQKHISFIDIFVHCAVIQYVMWNSIFQLNVNLYLQPLIHI